MRKGLVITLGVVALTFAVSQGFALAPVISTIPDVIISDFEQNVGQTVDQNFFVFSQALNLDDLVRDDDTSDSALRWSFVETGTNPWVRINGKSGVLVTGVRDPGTSNIRATTPWASFRNNRWSPITGQPPYPAPTPAGTSLSTTIQLAVSDAVNVTSAPILVTAVDTTIPQNPNMQKDALTPKPITTWPFTTNTGANAWTWYDTGGVYAAPTHASPAGQLEMTKAAGQALPVYGSWESPKDPSTAVKARWGAVIRARFRMRGSVNGAASPSIRFRALWTRVMQSGSSWIPDFTNQDFNDDLYVWYQTIDLLNVAGREPGTAGQTYTVLYYPQQIDTLMTTSAIVYFGCDLLDADSTGNDAGTLILDQVDVDSFARPSLGAPNMTSVPQLTYTTAGNWGWAYARQPINIPPLVPNSTGLTTSVVTGIRVNTVRGNMMQEISFVSPGGVKLDSGKYYRALYRAGSNMTPGGDFPPETRFGMVSSRLVFVADKHLMGGGLYSNLKSTGSDAELWVCAPSQTGSTQTENMSLRFEALLLTSTYAQFGNKNVSGSVWVSSVQTERMNNVP